MIGLVLVTHGRLAVEFRSALEHVVGPQRQIEAVTIGPDDDVEQRRKDIIEAVKRVDTGEGVAILTDMFGGTPSNLAISVMSRPKVEVLAGINLPMLVKLAKVRGECPLTEAVAAAQEAGRKYITIASRVLPANERACRRRRSSSRQAAAARGRDRARARDLQQEGPARARLRQVRADGREVRRRGEGDARRRDRRRHIDHGTDDAGGRPRHHITVEATGTEAAQVIEALAALVSGRFTEEE